jgi:N-acylglucosamine 2-epimerase (GlcNAc 2-epimerase)
VARLLRWHIDPAPMGLWIDRIDEKGRAVATEAPASIFYHLVTALMQYLDKTEGAVIRLLPASLERSRPGQDQPLFDQALRDSA